MQAQKEEIDRLRSQLQAQIAPAPQLLSTAPSPAAEAQRTHDAATIQHMLEEQKRANEALAARTAEKAEVADRYDQLLASYTAAIKERARMAGQLEASAKVGIEGVERDTEALARAGALDQENRQLRSQLAEVEQHHGSKARSEHPLQYCRFTPVLQRQSRSR
jgi:hypothetical protein